MKWLMAASLTLLVSVYVGSAQRGTLQRVSVGIPRGLLGNTPSYEPSISGDGRWVAFSSGANNLVSNDTNNARDVFVYDTQTETIRRISLSNTGEQGNDGSYDPRISRNGRYVVFRSAATNLVPDDTNNCIDAFVYDLHTNQITRVSVSSTGEQANDDIWAVDISADGRFVVFETRASNLVPNDTNDTYDIFVHDLHTRQTKRVSIASDGSQSSLESRSPRISGDGNLIVFSSNGELVPDDTNFVEDIFVHDQRTGITRRVSIGWNGQEANERCVKPAISVDGRYVAFQSSATNLVPNDTNYMEDIFVVDLQTNRIERVSVSSSGAQANRYSWYPVLSADGRFVAFQSTATNLVPNDTNNGWDIFVHDRQTRRTFRVSLTFLGGEVAGDCLFPDISADGRYVVFQSSASNLVPDDRNIHSDIFVRDTQAGTTRCVSVSNPTPQANGDSNLGALSADGRFVAFNSWQRTWLMTTATTGGTFSCAMWRRASTVAFPLPPTARTLTEIVLLPPCPQTVKSSRSCPQQRIWFRTTPTTPAIFSSMMCAHLLSVGSRSPVVACKATATATCLRSAPTDGSSPSLPPAAILCRTTRIASPMFSSTIY